jgi:hypothetical protein
VSPRDAPADAAAELLLMRRREALKAAQRMPSVVAPLAIHVRLHPKGRAVSRFVIAEDCPRVGFLQQRG